MERKNARQSGGVNTAPQDTIVAVSTPPGEGGIGIVRLSGPQALAFGDRLFRTRGGAPFSTTAPFRLTLGTVVDHRTDEPIDEALAVHMPVGRSYTGEPMVEFQSHAGRAILEGVIGSAVACGARIAEPGEFTRRAFLNGRLDLSQAEAVADLIGAESEDARRLALRQLRGQTGSEIRALRGRLIDLVSRAEAILDFSEEEGLPDNLDLADIETLVREVRRLALRGKEGNKVREGVRVVVAGRPNAGKSSLFNMLLDSPRSIVTPLPGTTRDFIEERGIVAGVSMVLIDTAGIHDPLDEVEVEGITRSLAQIAMADIIVYLIDGSESLHPADLDLLKDLRECQPLVVISKGDLPERFAFSEMGDVSDGLTSFNLSVVTGSGYQEFRSSLAERCRDLLRTCRPGLASPNPRHQAVLEKAAEHLETAFKGLRGGSTFDLVATDLRSSLDRLGEITGETATDEILQIIFSRFCIGK